MSNLIINNKYQIKQKLGEGLTSKVFLVKEIKTNNLYACKIQKSEKKNFLENEINFLSSFSHKNIVNKIESGEFEIKNTEKKTIKKKKCIILEYCEHGELCNYIYYMGSGFGEKYGKFIFNIILDVINEIHKIGFTHRDIKCENILLDKWFNIKIVDFGFATFLYDKKGEKKFNNFLGTFCYAAPEICENKKYDGKKIDIYSLGILLFILVTGKYFLLYKITKEYYDKNNKNYKNYEKFISILEKESSEFSIQFRDLFIKMINYNPNERPNYFEIKNHEWMKNIEINKLEMENHFKARDEYVRIKIEEEKIFKEIEEETNFESFINN